MGEGQPVQSVDPGRLLKPAKQIRALSLHIHLFTRPPFYTLTKLAEWVLPIERNGLFGIQSDAWCIGEPEVGGGWRGSGGFGPGGGVQAKLWGVSRHEVL